MRSNSIEVIIREIAEHSEEILEDEEVFYSYVRRMKKIINNILEAVWNEKE
jgi:hypothetical protein